MIYILLTWLLVPIWLPLAKFAQRRPPCRILLTEIAGIGDVVCSTAVFRALRKRFPAAHIDLLATPAVADLVVLDPHLNGVISLHPHRLRGVTGRLRLARLFAGYDTVICLNPSSPQLVAMAWAAVPRRFSVLPDVSKASYRWLAPLVNHTRAHVTGAPFVQTQLDLLRPLGIESHDRRKEIVVAPAALARAAALLPSDGVACIGIAIGSGLGLKEIPDATLVAAIGRLLDVPGRRVVLIGGQSEIEKGEHLSAALAGRPLINATGHCELRDLPGLLLRLSVLVGVDSGVTHIADALGVPIVCVVGPSSIHEQGPDGQNVVLIQRHPPCWPCSRVFVTPRTCATVERECVTSVSPGEVAAACERLLTAPVARKVFGIKEIN